MNKIIKSLSKDKSNSLCSKSTNNTFICDKSKIVNNLNNKFSDETESVNCIDYANNNSNENNNFKYLTNNILENEFNIKFEVLCNVFETCSKLKGINKVE